MSQAQLNSAFNPEEAVWVEDVRLYFVALAAYPDGGSVGTLTARKNAINARCPQRFQKGIFFLGPWGPYGAKVYVHDGEPLASGLKEPCPSCGGPCLLRSNQPYCISCKTYQPTLY